MRYAKLFGKTLRAVGREIQTSSHRFLLQAGYIRESSAGRYFFLPLGLRVHEKIQKIIEEEMDSAGAQRMVTPVLHPIELWQETNRNQAVGFELTKVRDRRGAEFALGGTAEEMFVDVVRKFRLSYKDLPLNLYQFSPKFRDELRARGGLLRVFEFTMKDAYSFDRNEAEFKKVYEKMKKTYSHIFERMGLKTEVVLADNGYIGGDYCHEFVVESPAGESNYFVSEDGEYIAHEEIAEFQREPENPGEKEKPFEIAVQPQWVQTMEDNVKHYKLPQSRFLKNVVYKTQAGKIVIGVIRGDLEVNPVKLRRALKLEAPLLEATEADLKKIGTKPGYVHSWGHKGVTYIGDLSLTTVRNFIGGQKEDETDSKNVNYGRDFKCDLADIAAAQPGFLAANGSRLVGKSGIEVGNIFQLGHYYSQKMKGANFIDEDGKEKPYYMGCYGIGLGRTMAAIVEKYHDEKGIIWPESVAPFQVHLLSLNLNDAQVLAQSERIYKMLTEAGIEVLYDDRKESAGVKFADADLIGIQWRAVVSRKMADQKTVEIKKRDSLKAEQIGIDKLLNKLKVKG
ncbi:proline--tRNA ligase [candidate division WWE3 bacterium CG_4_9_14_3_um_filter_43_9]|uniref:Proline--tRNA ligase n=1 Tax=candidate division WWE3 bacterium CG_4_9_14_3_um_filter_43_9 TaxID=1975082 RepID=A0A2M7WYX6_UNCKA|nr:MAG: proline--tRNA ligase [candidate division WWE3 bacterium CG_4_9_14_3_um_filter_43_9]